MDEAQDVIDEFDKVWDKISSWGINQRMILREANRWKEGIEIIMKIENRMRLLERDVYPWSKNEMMPAINVTPERQKENNKINCLILHIREPRDDRGGTCQLNLPHAKIKELGFKNKDRIDLTITKGI
ncbi:MAG: hypothetical protein V1915_00545 [Candidatus Bathyarchaeota archaeon]